jgi:type I restriction enzyme R subunit
MHMALVSGGRGKTMRRTRKTVEDAVNAEIDRIAVAQDAANASYFAFTATPKNKTLELFGERYV